MDDCLLTQMRHLALAQTLERLNLIELRDFLQALRSGSAPADRSGHPHGWSPRIDRLVAFAESREARTRAKEKQRVASPSAIAEPPASRDGNKKSA
jgi:hypothetical protein